MPPNKIIFDKYFLLFVGFALIILLSFFKNLGKGEVAQLPVLGTLTDFELIDQNGQAFTKTDLEGNIWIADFIFTTCAGPCPVMMSQYTDLQDRFSNFRKLNLLSISVYPEFDTPPVLKEYGDRYNANHDKWTFLTGDRNEIHRLAVDGFQVGSIEDPVFHSTRFILVDDKAQIRGYYISTELEDMQKLWRDAEILVKS